MNFLFKWLETFVWLFFFKMYKASSMYILTQRAYKELFFDGCCSLVKFPTQVQDWLALFSSWPWAVGVIVLVYFNKIISLPAPLLYYVFDRSVLFYKIPNICGFYPYFSMLFRFSIAICQLFILLTLRPLNQNTTDAQRKPKKELIGNHFQVARKRST